MDSYHLLFVEDDLFAVELLVAKLEEAGLAITSRTVETADQLREALRDERFDAVISDHRMPVFSGLEALTILRQSQLDLPFLLVTGAIGEEAAVEYMKAGAHDFLLKSNLSRLVPALQREVREAADRRRQHESEERYRTIVEATAEGIWMLDAGLRFTYANRRTGELLGMEPAQLIGRSVLEFLEPSIREEAASRWGPEETEPGVMDVCLQGRHGLFVQALVGSTPVRGGVLGMVTDISERRWLEQRLLEAEVEKKSFCRQILRAVTNGRLRLVEREEIPPLGTPALEIRLDAWNSYARLRANLADLARYEGFSEDAVSDLVMAVGEATTNAIKHAQGGLCQACVALDRVVVRISDEGSGMSPEDLPRILEWSSAQVSLGMGYSLILQLADAVWLATGPSGTVVQIELKRARAAQPWEQSWSLADLLSVL